MHNFFPCRKVDYVTCSKLLQNLLNLLQGVMEKALKAVKSRRGGLINEENVAATDGLEKHHVAHTQRLARDLGSRFFMCSQIFDELVAHGLLFITGD